MELNEYKEVLALVAYGILLALLGVVSVSVGSVAMAWSGNFKSKLNAIDSNPKVVAFGNSLTGKFMHDQLKQLMSQVDDADDQFIKGILELPYIRERNKNGKLRAEDLSDVLTKLIGQGVELLDGRANLPPAELAKFPEGSIPREFAPLYDAVRRAQSPAPLSMRFDGEYPPATIPQIVRESLPDEPGSVG